MLLVKVNIEMFSNRTFMIIINFHVNSKVKCQFKVQIKVPYKSLGQTIAYLSQPPAIRYYSKPALHSNSPTSVDQCKLIDTTTGEESDDTIINPLGLTAKGSVSNPRTKRNLRKVLDYNNTFRYINFSYHFYTRKSFVS